MREAIAIGVLICILVLAVVDTGVVNRKTDDLIGKIESAKEYIAAGDIEGAQELIGSSFKAWQEWDCYASIMLRHAEQVDTVTGAYYEIIEKLQDRSEVAPAAFDKLISNLRGLSSTGKLSLGALF